MPDGASRTASSLNGLMIAVTSFIWVSLASKSLLNEHGAGGLADVAAGERVPRILRVCVRVVRADVPAVARGPRHAELPVGVVERRAVVEAVGAALELLA